VLGRVTNIYIVFDIMSYLPEDPRILCLGTLSLLS
jgi:hypothetical protein